MTEQDFRYDDEIVDEEELPDDDTNIYGETAGLSEGYGQPVEGSTYLEDSEDEYGEEADSGYLSKVKEGVANLGYNEAAWASAGGAGAAAVTLGSPEAALLVGGTMGTAHLLGQASAKGFETVKSYLSGDNEEEESTDEQYATTA
ncbi:MAG: hypothetical protein ACI977_000787 [Candidatus Nanohaloarchaea archaeon]|jgi:hypothetical protein